MLINTHDCYQALFTLNEQGVDVTQELSSLLSENIITDSIIQKVTYLKSLPVLEFYTLLNSKAHKLIKEVLYCEGKPVSTYIKIATSLITQATITLEHQFVNDNEGANKFIECLGLANISQALSTYFNTGDYTSLVEYVLRTQEDVKLTLSYIHNKDNIKG